LTQHRKAYGVEPICRVLPIAPSTYYQHKAQQRDPTERSARAREDEELRTIIYCIWTEQRRVYGHGKVWRQMGFNIGPLALICAAFSCGRVERGGHLDSTPRQ
jgi:hypothetical protein